MDADEIDHLVNRQGKESYLTRLEASRLMMEDVECDFTVSTFVAVFLVTSRINGDVLDGVEATTGELPRA